MQDASFKPPIHFKAVPLLLGFVLNIVGTSLCCRTHSIYIRSGNTAGTTTSPCVIVATPHRTITIANCFPLITYKKKEGERCWLSNFLVVPRITFNCVVMHGNIVAVFTLYVFRRSSLTFR